MAICVFINDPPPLFRQLTNEPVRLDRIIEPGLHPPLFQAAFDHRLADLLPVWIKNRKLSARLETSEPKISELRHCRGS